MQMKNVEDFYPLSPMQEGMLFHTLLAPQSGVYVTQLDVELGGRLDVSLLRRAWQHAMQRHPVLRTSFLWEGVRRPVQVVHPTVEVPLTVEDWSGEAEAGHAGRIRAALEAERFRGFDLGQPPALRLVLIRLSEERHHFLWTLHHIILDAWSALQVLREVTLAYEALLRGSEPRLPPARPFRDYIVWLQRQDAGLAEAFWRETLRGFVAPTPLDLETGVSQVLPGEVLFGVEKLSLGAARGAALQAFARRLGLTLNSVVQGAWALLLSRYSGEDDIAFGFAVSGRPADLEGADSIVGLFVNTLVLRVPVTPQALLGAWLRLLQGWQAAARQFEYSPLVDVQGWSDVPKGLPLYETGVDFENYRQESAPSWQGAQDGLRILGVGGAEQSNVPVVLEVSPGTDLALRIRYDRRRFTAPAVARLLRHLEGLLKVFPDAAGLPVGELDVLSPGEREQILVTWNGTAGGGPFEACFHELFEAWADRSPEAPAILFEDRRLTYGELEARANRLAHHLIGLGVGPESLVALSLERSPELIVALLGILKAGAGYLPLDPGYPTPRLAYMLTDSRASLLVTRGELAHRFAGLEAPLMLLDSLDLEAGNSERPQRQTDPDNLAYVIYTSGSTGFPKGVAVRHRGLGNLVAAQRIFGAGPGKRILQFSPFSFDASAFEVAMALATGATLCLARRNLLLPGPDLLELLRQQAVTHLTIPPSVLAALLEGDLPDLETLVCAGEALPQNLAERWAAGRRLFNAYGPTEATVWSTVGLYAGAGKPDIGRPIGNTRTHLLDRTLRLVPPGVPGELHIGGIGLARGYLGRPDLTAQRFVPDPWSGEPGERLYKTGDLGRHLEDGRIEFLGRLDHQVKIRGFRIEVGEVEAALARHPQVREVAVIARQDGGPARLVAYLVPAEEEMPPTARELREALAETLPDHLIPSLFVVLVALPLTPNGKLDRSALPAPEGPAAREREAGEAYRGETEALVASLYAQVLNQERVDPRDSFFDLGGHSLLATQLVSRVRRAFAVEMPLRTLFEEPTVAGLARWIERALRDQEGSAPLPPISPVPREGDLPLSFAQQRLWFLDQLEPGNPAYNLHLALRIEGALDAAALALSLDEIVRRHEVLRTVFAVRDGVPFQDIRPSGGTALAALATIDLRALEPVTRERELERLVAAEARHSFDLRRGPLLCCRLIALGAQEHAMALTLHHIAGDAWSLGALVREIRALYPAFRAGRRPLLPELPIQYADYASWQRRWLQGEVLEAQLAYWRRCLGGDVPVLDLPADRPRPAVQTYRGGTRPIVVAAEVLERLRALARRESVTLFMLLTAASQALLHRYSGQPAIHLGTPVAGRNREETEPLIGFFVNTLVLRGELAGDPAFRDLLLQTREAVLGAFAHQDLPFEALVELLRPDRSLAVTPLFQVMLSLQNLPQETLGLSSLTLRSLEVENLTAKFDLELMFAERAGGLAGLLEFNQDLFDPATAERMAAHFQALLAALGERGELAVSALPLLSAAELRELLESWNATAAAFPLQRCFQEIFAESAQAHPELPAVACGDAMETYGELERLSNRAAHHLASLGVGTEEIVPLLAPRGIPFLTVVLAVLKSGGAYLPLDPQQPPLRLRQILAQSRARLVVAASDLAPRVEQALDGMGAEPPRIVLLEDLLRLPGPGGPLPLRSTPDSLAYVIFTSGSTGLPKGAMVSHRGMLNHLFAKVAALGLSTADRVAQNASQSFDISVWQLLAALLAGGCTEVFPDEVTHDPWRLLCAAQATEITVLELVPSVLQVVLEEAERRGGLTGDGRLRWLLATGEVLPADLCARWLAVAPEVPLLNAYGPTECSDDVTHHVIRRPLAPSQARVPIGRPIENTRLYVVRHGLDPQPVGVPGELCVGGSGVGRGYLHEPAKTAAVFVPDPFSATPGDRLYRTGDLARWLPDGSLDFLGRLDHQIKIRGFRIELSEIEAVLGRHPAVREAVVVASAEGGGRLAAYVAPEPGAALAAEELREHLRERVPEYMVPNDIKLLAALPRTANGKVDRKALPPIPATAQEEGREHVPPRDETERGLAALWEDLLTARPIGVTDDFFALGGHSLLAVRLMARIERWLGRTLPLATVMQEPTIAGLARVLREGREVGFSPLVAIRPRSVSGRPPLFCIHPIGGGVLCYHDLARYLDPEQPVYGLQAPDLSLPSASREVTIEEMAAEYLDAIVSVQPRGPYLLTGWSFGGVVAFEIARQMRHRGEEVGLIALLDTWAPGMTRRFIGTDESVLLSALVRDHAVQSGRELWIDPDELRPFQRDERLELVLSRVREAGLVPPEVDVEWVRRFLTGYQARSRALVAYSPEAYPGRLDLLRASDVNPEGARHLAAQGVDPDDPTRGWSELAAGPLVVRAVPGSHETMLMEPNLGRTAAQLQLAVEETLQRDRDPLQSAGTLTAGIPLHKRHAQP